MTRSAIVPPGASARNQGEKKEEKSNNSKVFDAKTSCENKPVHPPEDASGGASPA
jgi:hypothetical protein